MMALEDVLHHVARHEVAAVRGRIEEDVRRASFDAALESRLERLYDVSPASNERSSQKTRNR